MDRRLRAPLASAAALFAASAALQVIASLQRWVTASESWTRADRLVEDHLFDYFLPADPWEPIGTAAELLGVALLVLAAGIMALALALRGRGASSGLTVGAGLVASVPFGILGLHALPSGLIGRPSPLSALPLELIAWPVSALLSVVGLVALAVLWVRKSIAVAVAIILLLGNTLCGYLIATFSIAPAITGYQSYDTTPWTRTIVGASPALASVLLVAHLSYLAWRARHRSNAAADQATVSTTRA